MLKTKCVIKFRYVFEHWRDGKLLSREELDNTVPEEGLNYYLSVSLKGGTQQPNWFIGLYEGNYTPNGTELAATITSAATECTAYDEAARVAWVPAAPSAGFISNVASKAVFTMNDTKTVYGGFLVSSSTKAGAAGVLASVVRLSTAKPAVAGDIFRVAAGLTLANA